MSLSSSAGRAVALVRGKLGEARLAVELGKRGGERAERLLLGGDGCGKLGEHLLLDGERALGGSDDAALGLHQFGAREAHGAGHGLAVAEGCVERLAHQRLGRAGRHLDVVAEDVVVAHLEGLDAGLLDVAGLQCRHHLAAVVAQAPGLVEVGAEAGAHEVTVALEVWGRVDQGASEQGTQRLRASHQARCNRGERVGEADAAGGPLQEAGAGCGGGEPIAHGAEVARLASLQGKPRDRAGDVGRCPQEGPHVLAQGLVLLERADGIQSQGDGLGIAQGAGQARCKLARTGAGDRAVDGGEQAALPLPAERAQQLEAGAARRIDDEAVGGPGLARRAQAGPFAELSRAPRT